MPPLPPARSILPSLTIIQFKGASEYLEIFARTDVPRLNKMHMIFNQIIFNTLHTTLPAHQPKTDAEGTGTGPYCIWFQGDYCQILITDIRLRSTQHANPMHGIRMAAFIP